MRDRRTKVCRWGIYAAGAVLLALISGIYAFWLEGCADTSKSGDMLFYLRRAGVSKKVWLLTVLLFVMFIMYEHYGTRLTEFLYTWRFAIAAGMFVLCVACELNGSSIGAWQAYLGGTDTGTLLGAARPIRSDEWAVSTPMLLSQYRNAGGAFPYYSDTVRGAVTDMFMVYGQPVKDIAMIFKPFYWGYLFLPAGMGLALAEYRCKAVIGGAAAVIAGYAVVNCASFIKEDYYPGMSYYIFTVVLWILLFYLLLRYHEAGNRKRFSVLCIVVMIFAGALVNPVRRGVDNIYETETIQAIEEVHGQDPEALWAVEGVGFPCINMGIMAGAPTVNSTNVYPNLDRWEILDQKGTNEKVYNRYAHIAVVLKESGSPEFQLNQPDVFTVSLTCKDLKKLGVIYLLSGRDSMKQYESSKIKFIKVKKVGNYSIYRIE